MLLLTTRKAAHLETCNPFNCGKFIEALQLSWFGSVLLPTLLLCCGKSLSCRQCSFIRVKERMSAANSIVAPIILVPQPPMVVVIVRRNLLFQNFMSEHFGTP